MMTTFVDTVSPIPATSMEKLGSEAVKGISSLTFLLKSCFFMELCDIYVKFGENCFFLCFNLTLCVKNSIISAKRVRFSINLHSEVLKMRNSRLLLKACRLSFDGKTDEEIAAVFDVHWRTIANWRRRKLWKDFHAELISAEKKALIQELSESAGVESTAQG